MFKKANVALAVGLVASAVAGTASASAATVKLTDINNSYAKTAIQALVDQQIINGDGNGHFRPQATMTRDEFATLLAKTLGLTVDAAAASKFTDVESYARPYVGALVDAGITSGVSATQFGAKSPITRQDVAVFFIRALKQDQFAKSLNLNSTFADGDTIADYAKPSVALAQDIGLVNGLTDQDGLLVFDPTDNATREAVALMAYSFYNNYKTNYTATIDTFAQANDILTKSSAELKQAGSYEVTTDETDSSSDQSSLNVHMTTDYANKPIALHTVGTVKVNTPAGTADPSLPIPSDLNADFDVTLVNDRVYADVNKKWYMATLPDTVVQALQSGDLSSLEKDLPIGSVPGTQAQLLPLDPANLTQGFFTKDLKVTTAADGSTITLTGTLNPLFAFNQVDSNAAMQAMTFKYVINASNYQVESMSFTGTSTDDQSSSTSTFSQYGAIQPITVPDMSETPTATVPATTSDAGSSATNGSAN